MPILAVLVFAGSLFFMAGLVLVIVGCLQRNGMVIAAGAICVLLGLYGGAVS